MISKGRDAQALKVLAYYHADDNKYATISNPSIPQFMTCLCREDPLVKYEYEEIKASIEFDRTVAANVGWLSLFKTVGNRKRMRIIIAIAFFSQWSGNGLVSYYLNQVFNTIGITDPTTQVNCTSLK